MSNNWTGTFALFSGMGRTPNPRHPVSFPTAYEWAYIGYVAAFCKRASYLFDQVLQSIGSAIYCHT